MTIREARCILVEMQKWRRGEQPYDKVGVQMPHTPEEFGKAIDTAIDAMDLLIKEDKQ